MTKKTWPRKAEPNPAYKGYVELITGAPFKYRAPHANRPTAPKRKW